MNNTALTAFVDKTDNDFSLFSHGIDNIGRNLGKIFPSSYQLKVIRQMMRQHKMRRFLL
jgi:hypothetical protein